MDKINRLIHLVGAGNMGRALLRGLLAHKLVPPQKIFVEEIDPAKLRDCLRAHGVRPAGKIPPGQPRLLLLCLKPQQFPAWAGRAPALDRRTLVVSIMAGVTRRRLQAAWPAPGGLVRAMPNLPGLVGAGFTALCGPAGRVKEAQPVFSTLGETIVVREAQMDAVTALSGSGPAYVFYLGEALAAAARRYGFSREASERLARQTVFGAARLWRESGRSAAELRQQVTSPGGTTEAACRLLSQKAWADILGEAIAAARQRARELSPK